jgi:hypothetical protein
VGQSFFWIIFSSIGNLSFVEINPFYEGFNIANLTAYSSPLIIVRRYFNGRNHFPGINHRCPEEINNTSRNVGSWKPSTISFYAFTSFIFYINRLSWKWSDYFGYIGHLTGFDMDFSWREMRQIIRRPEEILEANRSTLQPLLVKIGELEESLTQRIESLENECLLLRSMVMSQPIQSISINQVSVASR